MTKIELNEMTIKSLFNISKIPYDPNQSFTDKITILRNADLLQKEQNYSIHTELSENDNTDIITTRTDIDSFDLLVEFFTDNSDTVNVVLTWLILGSDKYPEGEELNKIPGRISLKKNYYTNKPIQIVEEYRYDGGYFTNYYNNTGKWAYTDSEGSYIYGDWHITSSNKQLLILKSYGYSDYYGNNLNFYTKITKTKEKKFYPEEYIIHPENGNKTLSSLARFETIPSPVTLPIDQDDVDDVRPLHG